MRKPIFPRILLLVLLYSVVFVALISIQFTKRGGFTRRTGNFVVSGKYRLPGENDPPKDPNEYFLDGDVHVFFGGIDFSMNKGDDGHSFTLTQADGTKEETLPERMVIAEDSVSFLFPGGTELIYSTQYSGGSLEMRISGTFSEGISGADLPFKPLRKAVMKDSGDGQLLVRTDGINYSFGHSPMDTERRMLLIKTEGTPVTYQAIPEHKTFVPNDFILPQAKTAEAYKGFITRWRDQNFSLWNRTIQEQSDEDVVIAFEGEALVRGTYKSAVAAVSPAFLKGTARTYESSVYIGGLDQAYRSLMAKEREKIARLSRQINEKSLEFLKEPSVFKYFAVRGHNNFIDTGADLVRTIDPAILALDITPGILEGYVDWKNFRPNTDNPFERLVDQACFVISESLRKTANNSGDGGVDARVFSFSENQGDTEFNLRLGKALLAYAEDVNNTNWAGIGRSLIVSALSMGDASGAVKAGLVITGGGSQPSASMAVPASTAASAGTGEISESPEHSELTTARLYRILNPLDTYPRAVSINASPNNIWTWTAAQTVSATQQNDTMDITVRFPASETHYMIIRGIRPFVRVQLYNMDFRSDSQFERYDSSGWVYYPQDQVMVLKMKHQKADELIRIIFKEAAMPAATLSGTVSQQNASDDASTTEETAEH